MNDNSNKTSFETEFARLESRLQELLVTVEALREENRALRQRQESLAAERSVFAQRNVMPCRAYCAAIVVPSL